MKITVKLTTTEFDFNITPREIAYCESREDMIRLFINKVKIAILDPTLYHFSRNDLERLAVMWNDTHGN